LGLLSRSEREKVRLTATVFDGEEECW